MSSDDAVVERSIRSAGTALIVSGLTLVVVIVYLLAVLLPLGLTFDMFDDARALVDWASSHTAAYLSLYLLYIAQQLLLLAAPVLLWRHLPSDGRPTLRASAASAAVISIALAALSSALLVMSTHTAIQYWALASSVEAQSQVEMVFDGGADLAKGARLISEVFLAIWLVWLGVVLRRHGKSSRRHAWLVVVAVGLWTAVVGVWKLLDPTMEYEDWVAFLIGGAQVAAGLGMWRLASATARQRGLTA